MDTLQEFTKKLLQEFEDIDVSGVKHDTPYKEIPGWGSVLSLIVIAHIDAEYDVMLEASEIKQTNTVEDLYNVVLKKV